MTTAREFLDAYDKAIKAGLIRRPAKIRGGKLHRRNVCLDDAALSRALALGDGQVSLGIRRALEKALP